jgi:hypothetical protein
MNNNKSRFERKATDQRKTKEEEHMIIREQ